MSRVPVVVALFAVLGACQPLGPEPAPRPAPADAGERLTRPAQPPPTDDGRRDPPPGLPGFSPETFGIDAILHSRASTAPEMRERTEFWIDFWTSRGRDHFGRYLERKAVYHHHVAAELERRGMPASLVYLPIVESGYHHGAVSRVGATGLWQIMAPTARDLGLSVTAVVDDRRDPLAATRAALDYLERLHAGFDSWFLALAAYNAGSGRVRRILDQYAPAEDLHGDELYVRLRSRFPAETRDFVPRFFAAAALASDPERFGFALPVGIEPLAFDEVSVPDATSLDVIARAAEVGEAEIRELNPHFVRGYTPPGEARALRVPPGRGERFTANFALIPPEERISFVEHVVARGETLSHIAGRYGVRLAELSDANGRVDPRRLQIGQTLIVPIAGAPRPAPVRTAAAAPTGSGAVSSAPADDSAADGDGTGGAGGVDRSPAGTGDRDLTALRHHVASGENLWTLARRYGVSVNDLRRWNGLREGAVLRPGQELVVGSGVQRHRVAAGDTLGGIARRYGISIDALARANGRSARDVIRVGEELRIP